MTCVYMYVHIYIYIYIHIHVYIPMFIREPKDVYLDQCILSVVCNNTCRLHAMCKGNIPLLYPTVE